MTDVIPEAIREWWLAESDRHDRELTSWLRAWQAGYAAGEAAHEDDYGQGFYDGRMANKRAEHYAVDLLRLQVARYGAGSRQVTDPRPDDFPMLLTGLGDGE